MVLEVVAMPPRWKCMEYIIAQAEALSYSVDDPSQFQELVRSLAEARGAEPDDLQALFNELDLPT